MRGYCHATVANLKDIADELTREAHSVFGHHNLEDLSRSEVLSEDTLELLPSVTVTVIGNLKLDRVATSDIAKMHRLIGRTKPMTANRVVECVSSIYRYAAICGLIVRGHNPTSHIEAFREQRRERFLNSEELARLGDAIREAETTGILWEVDDKQADCEPHP